MKVFKCMRRKGVGVCNGKGSCGWVGEEEE